MADLDWVAGLFEGEGSIQIVMHQFNKPDGNRRTTYVLRLGIQMLDEDCVREVERILTGRMTVRIYRSRFKMWRWEVTSAAALRALELLAPHFRSARVRAKAELALTFQRGKEKGRPQTPEYQERQRLAYESMKVLNKRGDERVASFT